LAQPKLVVEKDSKLIAWRYEYPMTSNHLSLEKKSTKKLIENVLTPREIYYDHVFVISITQLMYDIVDSVIRSDGYISKLDSRYKKMQIHFDEAIDQIYGTSVISRNKHSLS
jgi:hypothetical protein